MAYSLINIGGKDVLLPYATTGLLMFYFFMRKNDSKIYFPKEALLFILYITYLIISLFFHAGIFAKSLTQLVTIILHFFFYLLIVNILIIQKSKGMLKIVNYFIFVCVIFSMYSSLQVLFQVNSILFAIFRNARAAFFIWEPGASSNLLIQGLSRVTGFAPEPANWAAFLTIPLSLLIPRLILKRRTKDLCMFLPIFMCFILTYGRTGWLSLLFVILLFPVFFLTGNKRTGFSLIALGAISIIFASVVLFGFGAGGDWSRKERAAGMFNGGRMFLSSPIFGVGLGKYEINLENVAIAGLTGGTYGHMTYNYYLSVLAETGIIGLSLWLMFLCSFWNKLFAQYDQLTDNRDLKILCIGVLMAYLSILFSWLNVGGINFMYIWFVLALTNSMPVIIKRERRELDGTIEKAAIESR